jgi:hypothetical protein
VNRRWFTKVNRVGAHLCTYLPPFVGRGMPSPKPVLAILGLGRQEREPITAHLDEDRPLSSTALYIDKSELLRLIDRSGDEPARGAVSRKLRVGRQEIAVLLAAMLHVLDEQEVDQPNTVD